MQISRSETGFRSGSRCRRVGSQRTEEQARSGFRSGVRCQGVEKQGRRGADQAQAWNRPGPGVESSWVVSRGSALEAFLVHFPVPLKLQGKYKKSEFCFKLSSNFGFSAPRLKASRELKIDTLKTWILMLICLKILTNS